MAGVFKNIDPHPPLRPASIYPNLLVRGEDTLAGWRGGGVNILEDARHSSVLYIRKYFVLVAVCEISVKSFFGSCQASHLPKTPCTAQHFHPSPPLHPSPKRSGSISQRYGSGDPNPDPHQNVTDPQHCLSMYTRSRKIENLTDNTKHLKSIYVIIYFLLLIRS
jgi:hypothetical protein